MSPDEGAAVAAACSEAHGLDCNSATNCSITPAESHELLHKKRTAGHDDADDAEPSTAVAIAATHTAATAVGGAGAATSVGDGREAGTVSGGEATRGDGGGGGRRSGHPPLAKRRRSGKEPASSAAVTSTRVAHGLRWVEPYHHTFETHAKGRWVGREILEVFAKEFQSEPREAYEAAIKAGQGASAASSLYPHTQYKVLPEARRMCAEMRRLNKRG